MCGIVGILGPEGTSAADMDAALDQIGTRGPDHRGSTAIGWGCLGHTRLSIIDLDERSNQPFVSRDGRWILVYNGELYNYLELRSELTLSGAWVFATGSDTEVVMAALATWGPTALSRFNGMWALCLVDTLAHSALLSRDRFGVKPLFVHFGAGGRLAFGSRVRAIQSVIGTRIEPDLQHVAGYLITSETAWGRASFFASVSEVEPGSFVEWRGGVRRCGRYWQRPNVDRGGSPDPDEVEELVRDSVRKRLRSDVPVGVTLSGGLDSSVILAAAAQEGADVVAFTASIDGHPADESMCAKRLADALGVPWVSVPIGVDKLDLYLASRVVEAMDGPPQSPAALALWGIAAECRRRDRLVVLEGQGADEVFAGYVAALGPHIVVDRLRARQLSAAKSQMRVMARQLGGKGAAVRVAREVIPGVHAAYRAFLGIRKTFGPGLRDVPLDTERAERRWSMTGDDVLGQQMDVTLRALLEYGDRITMAHGVEARQPFLDYRLVDILSRYPATTRFGTGQGKDVLRAVGSRLLPIRDPLEAPKRGFPMPVREWMMDPRVRERLMDGEGVRRRLFCSRGIERMLLRNQNHRSPMTSLGCFRLLMTELWLESVYG